MKTVIFIPARYPSQRFPGKPLALLTGATGEARSLIHRSWEAAQMVEGVEAVYVLTDDARISEAASAFGAAVLMTSERPRNGTERCAEALDLLPELPDVVVNLQGDAPLTPPHYVSELIGAMADGSVQMATPVLRTETDHLQALRDDRQAGRVGATTAVFRDSGDALYFSKEVLPFADKAHETGMPVSKITEMIGDQHSTVVRLLEGYRFIRQLIETGHFRPSDSQKRGRGSVSEYPFSWVSPISKEY